MVRSDYNLIGTRGSIREGKGYLLQAEGKSGGKFNLRCTYMITRQ